MKRGPLIAAWAATLAVLAGTAAWIELGDEPEATEQPTLTLVIPDRPAAPAPAAEKPEQPAPAPAAPEQQQAPSAPQGAAKPAAVEPPKPESPPPAQATAPQQETPAATEPAPAANGTKPAANGTTQPDAPKETATPVPAPDPAREPTGKPTEPETARNGEKAPPNVTVPNGSPQEAPPPAPPRETAPPVQPAEKGFHGVDPQLVEDGPHGPLPTVGPLGQKPWEVYARPFEPPEGKVRVTLVMTDLGLGTAATRRAVDGLPGAISLAFLSYADDAAVWLQRARAAGHEVLLAVPMEPAAKTDDPGPRALTAGAAPDDNVDLLEWHMSRASAYVGVTTHLGGRFLATESAVQTILAPLRDRGLMLLDASLGTDSTSGRVARNLGVPFVAADRIVDAVPSRAAIDRRLTELEELARKQGGAVGIARPYPVSIDAIAAWVSSLADRGMVLAPVSAAARGAGPTPAATPVSNGRSRP